MSAGETIVEWRCTWFPPDRPDASRTGTEAQVRKTAELKADWFPIIETRTIVTSGWEIAEPEGVQEGNDE